MVKDKPDYHYTFRIIGEDPLIVEVQKWEEFSDFPTASYKVDIANPSVHSGCSCPAYTSNCVHRKCVQEALSDGKAKEFHKWWWDRKHGWHPSGIATIEELSDG